MSAIVVLAPTSRLSETEMSSMQATIYDLADLLSIDIRDTGHGGAGMRLTNTGRRSTSLMTLIGKFRSMDDLTATFIHHEPAMRMYHRLCAFLEKNK